MSQFNPVKAWHMIFLMLKFFWALDELFEFILFFLDFVCVFAEYHIWYIKLFGW